MAHVKIYIISPEFQKRYKEKEENKNKVTIEQIKKKMPEAIYIDRFYKNSQPNLFEEFFSNMKKYLGCSNIKILENNKFWIEKDGIHEFFKGFKRKIENNIEKWETTEEAIENYKKLKELTNAEKMMRFYLPQTDELLKLPELLGDFHIWLKWQQSRNKTNVKFVIEDVYDSLI